MDNFLKTLKFGRGVFLTKGRILNIRTFRCPFCEPLSKRGVEAAPGIFSLPDCLRVFKSIQQISKAISFASESLQAQHHSHLPR